MTSLELSTRKILVQVNFIDLFAKTVIFLFAERNAMDKEQRTHVCEQRRTTRRRNESLTIWNRENNYIWHYICICVNDLPKKKHFIQIDISLLTVCTSHKLTNAEIQMSISFNDISSFLLILFVFFISWVESAPIKHVWQCHKTLRLSCYR